MAITYVKTWQQINNYRMSRTSATLNCKNQLWFHKAFIKGDISPSGLTLNEGLWTVDYSCDGTTAGSAGDGIDRWGAQGSTTANSGAAASITTGASIVGAVRLTGLTGMSAASVGNCMTISGAATAANNSKTNTPWRIVAYVSATSVDIYNPAAVTGDANNGSITWAERGQYTFDDTKLVPNSAGSAHSWIVLKSPAALGPYYICFDYTTGNQYQYDFVFAKTAFTGGTTLNRPTSTDEIATTSLQFNRNATKNYTNGLLATDGTFAFFSTEPESGLSGFSYALMFMLPVSRAADLYPIYVFRQYNATTVMTRNDLGGETSTFHFMRRHDGLAAATGISVLYPYNTNLNALINDVMLTDGQDGYFNPLDMYVFNRVAGYKSLRGRIVDFYWGPTNLPVGYCSPNPTSPESVTVGVVWTPLKVAPVIG